ncbi:MAG: acetyl-CoA carboxylase biotin carboxyl carrier protein [Oscillospiraceae bacterium]|jgi:acetyl-CoA carboxylase biotin carboxyl carrier protein|nr:acetyl-CoA carboxylase biotin carboxyl carrier protein [Oscillospiraceae bacterium]
MNQQETLALLDGLLARLKDTDVTDLSLTCGDISLRVRRGHPPHADRRLAAPTPDGRSAPLSPPPTEAISAAVAVKAPLVGTFYAAPGPDRPPFVSVGAKVSKGDTLCIVEAMKTMNEIEAERDGRITRVLAQNGDLVEFGQPLFEMEVL